MRDRELVQEIYKVQQERKCLVVLDDIWTMEAWNSLNPAFPIKEAAGHSKVLLTTRIERVAKEGYPHNLRYLNKEEGWELLQKKAFPIVNYGPESKVDKEIEKIGRVMVQKCGGLPLAISVRGGLLKDKGTSGDWDMVNRDIVTYLKRGGENIDEKQGAIEQVLALSYYNLPYRLKPCFLYLSHFLKDESIKVEQLCLLWIAEGMISSEDQSEGETLMEVAERYLGELAQRSMVQVISLVDPSMRSTTNRYGSCQIHDLMHDLCLSMGKEEDFFHVLDFRSRGNIDSSVHLNLTSSRSDTKARRFALYVHDEYLGSDIHTFRSRRIRSMLIHSTRLWWKNLKWPLEVSELARFSLLRVLQLTNIDFDGRKFPEGISKLIHLRYISLRQCIWVQLPSSIGNLRYLQTLDLYVTYAIKHFPNVLWKLKSLRHLYLPRQFQKEKDDKLRLGDLSGLETLKNFDTNLCHVNDLEKLTNLRNLSLYIRGSHEDVATVINYLNINSKRLRKSYINIAELEFRTEVELSLLGEVFQCCSLEQLSLVGHIGKLPEFRGYNYSTRLTTLSLCNSKLEKDPFATFEKLPNLQNLSLHKSYEGTIMTCSALGFPQLRRLQLRCLQNVEIWSVD